MSTLLMGSRTLLVYFWNGETLLLLQKRHIYALQVSCVQSPLSCVLLVWQS
jgi:hypothetical protein